MNLEEKKGAQFDSEIRVKVPSWLRRQLEEEAERSAKKVSSVVRDDLVAAQRRRTTEAQ